MRKATALITALVAALAGLIPATAASADGSWPRVSGTLRGADGQPIVGLKVAISSDPWWRCGNPDQGGAVTQADGSFSFLYDLDLYSGPGAKFLLCFGGEPYGGPTWANEDGVYVDLSSDLDVGVVQRAPEAKISLTWTMDERVYDSGNEDSTSNAHAVNLDTGRVYRGRYDTYNPAGTLETIDVPLGRYKVGVDSLWFDPETWIYYPGVTTADDAAVVDVSEDVTLPGSIDATPAVVSLYDSDWGDKQTWQIESCTSDWKDINPTRIWGTSYEYGVPVGTFRFAVVRDGERVDWTDCIQTSVGGSYRLEWKNSGPAVAPRYVSAGVGRATLIVFFLPGEMDPQSPTLNYRVSVRNEQTGIVAEVGEAVGDQLVPENGLTASFPFALQPGVYRALVTGVRGTGAAAILSEPTRSRPFTVGPTSSPTPTASPTPSVSPSPSSSATEAVAGPTPTDPRGGSSSGVGTRSGKGGSLAATGVLAPPVALPMFALVALMAGGVFRFLSRRSGMPAGRRSG